MSHIAKPDERIRVSPPRFHRHWGLSAATRRQLGWCDAALVSLRESPIPPGLQTNLGHAALTQSVAATLALAGGSLTEAEVASALAGRKLPPSRKHLGTEARNVAAATRMLLAAARVPTPKPVSPTLLLRVHRALSKGLGAHFAGSPGAFRGTGEAAGVPCPPARAVPDLVERLCSWVEQEMPAPEAEPPSSDGTDSRGALPHTATADGPRGPQPTGTSALGGMLAHAAAAHAYLAWIRPFADGNGRAARLLETYALARAGVPSLAASLATVHYAKTRRRYGRRLRQTVADRSPTAFVSYAVAGFRDGLAALSSSIRDHQWQAAWRAFVFARFDAHEHHKKTVMRRRRELALSLPLDRPIGPADATALDAGFARTYRTLSERTLERDLDALVETGVATEHDGQYLAAAEALRVR